jgi:hypothetical protein
MDGVRPRRSRIACTNCACALVSRCTAPPRQGSSAMAARLPSADQFPVPARPGTGQRHAQVIYLELLPTALGFTTWPYALARTTSGKMGRHYLPKTRHHVPAHSGTGPPTARRHRRIPLREAVQRPTRSPYSGHVAGGAGGARTHDRRIMRSPARRIVRTTCTDATEPCRLWR